MLYSYESKATPEFGSWAVRIITVAPASLSEVYAKVYGATETQALDRAQRLCSLMNSSGVFCSSTDNGA